MFKTDKLFKAGTLCSASIIGALMIALFACLFTSSADAWKEFGIGFLWSGEWDPTADRYGALPALAGTLITTVIALLVALPPAFTAALYLSEAPPSIGKVLSQAIDLLAAIPSIIYGMWGFFVLVPIMQDYVKPFFIETLGLDRVPIIGGFLGSDPSGYGFLTAGLILALMILPYICAIMRDVFKMTPPMLRESAFGVGCTRWETAKDIVMKYGFRGLLGGVFIGLGRALGETMAVLFVIGNLTEIPTGIFGAGTTIAATLANNFAEAQGLQQSVLFALGLILLALSFSIQVFAQYYLVKTSAKRGESAKA